MCQQEFSGGPGMCLVCTLRCHTCTPEGEEFISEYINSFGTVFYYPEVCGGETEVYITEKPDFVPPNISSTCKSGTVILLPIIGSILI